MLNFFELWPTSTRYLMQFIDTHCHLYLEEFSRDIEEVIRRAGEAGVIRFFLPNIDSGSEGDMMNLEHDYQDVVFSMMGLHPCSVKENWKTELKGVEEWLARRSFRGVGEVGLDYYWDRNFDKEQAIVFDEQLKWSRDLSLPIIIHSRDSMDDCIKMVEARQDGRLKGIFHCFTGNYDQARKIIDAGFYLGIGGVVTYKNSGLDKILDRVELNRLVLETDAPYLSPVPYRGKRNESSYIPIIAQRIAEIKKTPVEEVASVTTANANLIFNA